jgi:hypothetical protein
MTRNKNIHAPDYRVVLNRVSVPDLSRRGRYNATKMETMLNFWCMSASVVFKEIDAQCHSVLLTSGTLSPLDSFASELGANFPVRVEASHVINVATQLFVGVVSTCNDVSLKGVCALLFCYQFALTIFAGDYQNQTSTHYQDAIGASLTAISRVTPGGVLVFVSSYTMMNRLKERWDGTGGFATYNVYVRCVYNFFHFRFVDADRGHDWGPHLLRAARLQGDERHAGGLLRTAGRAAGQGHSGSRVQRWDIDTMC